MEAGDAANEDLSCCVGCRKRRRACSKGTPRCELCQQRNIDCVYRLWLRVGDGGGQRSYRRLLVNGVETEFDSSRLAVPEQKPACEACHRGKRQCPGGIPCARCAAKGVECREWVRAKRQSKKRAIESPDEDEKPIDNPQPPARKRGRPRKSPEAVDGADRREPANEPDEVVQSNYDQILETNRTTMNVTEIGVVEVVEEIAPTFPLFDPLRSFSFGSSGELSPRAELWMASHEPSDYFNFSIRGEPAAVNIRKLQNDVGYSEDSEDAEHGRNLMEAPKRVPGSWNPPISPPPQTVDAFFSFFPSSDRLPPAEQVNSLMSTFREQCSSMFVYLHNEVLPAPNDPSFVGSLCLAAIQWSEDAEINRSSIDIQYRLFVRSMQRILAVLDKYLPERSLFVIPHPDDPVDLVKTAREDQELDPLCETVFSIAMLAFWAYNRGLAKLFEQLVDVAFRMMFRIGLHRDILYGPEHLFGQTNPRQAWIRRSQRRTLFFILLYFLNFASHFIPKSYHRSILAISDRFIVPPFQQRLWKKDSLDPAFNPRLHEPANQPLELTGRPLSFGDLVAWMKLPSDRPERHFHVSLIGHVLANDTRFGWTVDFVYWRIRFHVNGFLRRCKRAGVSPAAVVAGSNNPEISALFAQREHLDRIILDLLAALPADMRAAEEEGEYSRLMEYFVNKDPDVDPDRIGAHIKTQYIIAIRLLRLEIKSGFGIHTFNEIAEGAMDQEFDGSQSFSECLRESVIYTRHLSSLMDVDPTLRFAFYSSGLLAPKVGALHLALLSRLLSSPMREHHRKILYDLRADLNVCLAFIRRGPDSRPVGSSAWQTMLSTVFAKVVTRLESMESYRSFFGAEGVGGWSPGEGNRRRQFSQSAMQVLMNPKGLVVFGLEASEIERVHFRKDVTLGGPDEWTFIEAAGTLETRWKGN